MLALCLSFALAAPAEPEDIPLQAIGAKNDTPAVVAPPPKPLLGLLVGAKLGGQFGVAGPMGGSVLAALEVGYRLPVLRRIPGVSLEITYANPGATRSTVLGTERTSTSWLSLPLYASASLDLGPGLLRFLAGPALEWWWAHSALSGSGFSFNDAAISIGAAGLVSYGLLFGPGALSLELRYRYGLPHFAADAQLAHSIGLTAGYVFLL